MCGLSAVHWEACRVVVGARGVCVGGMFGCVHMCVGCVHMCTCYRHFVKCSSCHSLCQVTSEGLSPPETVRRTLLSAIEESGATPTSGVHPESEVASMVHSLTLDSACVVLIKRHTTAYESQWDFPCMPSIHCLENV